MLVGETSYSLWLPPFPFRCGPLICAILPGCLCSASASVCLQTVGGDELNVCVALAHLGHVGNGTTNAPKVLVAVG